MTMYSPPYLCICQTSHQFSFPAPRFHFVPQGKLRWPEGGCCSLLFTFAEKFPNFLLLSQCTMFMRRAGPRSPVTIAMSSIGESMVTQRSALDNKQGYMSYTICVKGCLWG